MPICCLWVTFGLDCGIIRLKAGVPPSPRTGPAATKESACPCITLADRIVEQSLLDNRAPSVGALFRSRVAATPDAPAYLYFKDGGTELTTLTWTQTHDIVTEWAAGLIALGVELEDRVAIASTTRLEWVLADLAIVCAGGATTTVYPTTIAEDVAYILEDSGSAIVFAEDAAQVAKLRGVPSRDPARQAGRRACRARPATTAGSSRPTTSPRRGRELPRIGPATRVDARIDQLGPDSLAVVIYTSGTTGRPKGVRLTQDSVVYEGAVIEARARSTEDDLQFLWLPLSHVFGKMLLAIGLQIGFPTAVDGRIDKIVDNMAVIKPTFMAGPPRIFEKAHGRVELMFAHETGVKKQAHRLGAQGRRRDARRARAGRAALAGSGAPARARRPARPARRCRSASAAGSAS